MIEIKAMFTEKSDALRVIEQAQEAERKHLEYFQDGYMEGYDNGWDEALNNVQTILKRYSIGGEKSDLKPATKFMSNPVKEQLQKIKEELAEVMHAYQNESKERIAEELVDVQQACETALAMLGLSEDERSKMRKKVLLKNASRGYYNGDYHAS
jgi:phosphoribosyl-ATP pyrophosphohydrolase